jgi:hypothetical protein
MIIFNLIDDNLQEINIEIISAIIHRLICL